jgi:3(or 17)beta-hydroxysteroid dehydrogenase
MGDRLAGKVAVITGGAGGFGQAIARAFGREGAHVIITDVNRDSISNVADALGCLGLVQDVTDEAKWTEIIAEAEQRHGKLDILVNNAGILGDLEKGSPEETRLDDFNRVQAVNVTGTFLGCKSAIPALRRAGGGSIVNVSSIAAFKGTWFETAYGVSKAGIKQLTMSVAQHGAKENIRCNVIHPGQMETAMSDYGYQVLGPKFGMTSPEATLEMMMNFTPMGRLGKPEDVANAALFFASDESNYVTGASLLVDGGMGVL